MSADELSTALPGLLPRLWRFALRLTSMTRRTWCSGRAFARSSAGINSGREPRREAAEALDVPVGTVMSRLARARITIGQLFSAGDEQQSPAPLSLKRGVS